MVGQTFQIGSGLVASVGLGLGLVLGFRVIRSGTQVARRTERLANDANL